MGFVFKLTKQVVKTEKDASQPVEPEGPEAPRREEASSGFRCRVCGWEDSDGAYCRECLADTMDPAKG